MRFDGKFTAQCNSDVDDSKRGSGLDVKNTRRVCA